MNRHGLSAADWRSLTAAMGDTHRVKVRVELLDLGENHLAHLTDVLVDGQLNFDDTQGPLQADRFATVVLNDPHRALPFDSDSPADGALWFDRMIRLIYAVKVSDWVECAMLTGPVTSLARDGQLVTASVHGKEVLSLGSCWQPLHIAKGTKKTDAIRTILASTGETKLDIPDLPSRLPHHMTLTPDDKPWVEAHKIAKSLDRQLYYDGGGWCRLRRHPVRHVFTFTGKRHIVSRPKLTGPSTIVNAVRVIGAVPKGAKTHVHAEALATGPLSPDRLGRNGARRFLMPNGATIRDDKIKTTAEAQARANRIIADSERQPVTVTFDAIPGPLAFLDPGDYCRAQVDDGSVGFRLAQASMPLNIGSGQPMSVGYLDRRLRHHTTRPPRHHHRPPRKHR